MKQGKFQELSATDRPHALEANANATTVEKVERQLTDQQRADMKNRIVTIDQRDLELTEEMQAFNEPRNKEKKTLATEKKTALKTLKKGFTEDEEKLYIFFDQDAGTADYIDVNGEIIKSRKLRPEERQTSIVDFQERTGTRFS